MIEINSIVAEKIMTIISNKEIKEIDKPKKGKTEILRINENGFQYRIGEGTSKKIVSKEELIWAINKLKKDYEFSKKEYEIEFPKKSRSNPCNFTSIGGMLSRVMNVKYSIGKYYIN